MTLSSTRSAFSALFGLFELIISSAAAASERIAVDAEGEGSALVVIPGLTSSPDIFRPFAEHVGEHQVHWVTLAGFDGVPAPDNLDAFTRPAADALGRYIVDNDLRDVRLVGHSMGGVIALMLAHDYPNRIDHVLIIDSVPYLAGLLRQGTTPENAAAGQLAMREQFAGMPRDAFLGMMRQGLPVQATSAESQAVVWDDIEASDQQAVAVAISEIYSGDFRAMLGQITSRVTVLIPHNAYVGTDADSLRARYADQYSSLARVSFRIIEDSRHFIMLDQPDAFADALQHFVQGDDQ